MEPHEAWEAVRENHLFLPSEEDELSLGENPNPEPEPTPVAEFRALRITEVLRRPSERRSFGANKWLQELPRIN